MDLKIHERKRDGIVILDLKGSLVIGESEAFLREIIRSFTNAGSVNIVLNCAELNEIDEDGLGFLVACSARLRREGGALKLLNLRRDHLDLVVLGRLEGAFDVYTDEISAVNGFFPERTAPSFNLLEYAKRQKAEYAERHKNAGGRT